VLGARDDTSISHSLDKLATHETIQIRIRAIGFPLTATPGLSSKRLKCRRIGEVNALTTELQPQSFSLSMNTTGIPGHGHCETSRPGCYEVVGVCICEQIEHVQSREAIDILADDDAEFLCIGKSCDQG
jgi:hypothetical protein